MFMFHFKKYVNTREMTIKGEKTKTDGIVLCFVISLFLKAISRLKSAYLKMLKLIKSMSSQVQRLLLNN